jgi:hypothetical protein
MSISWLDLSKVLIVAAAARALYETRQQQTKLLPNPGGCHGKLTDPVEGDNVETEPSELPPQLQKWAKKSAQNYARAQEKKWRNWEKAMFSR